MAAATDTPVEIQELRTPTTRWFANPDGTFTSDQSMDPRWTRKNGVWVDLDPVLERSPDGRIRPRAAAIDMSFSGGGSASMVSLRQDAEQLALHWTDPLPVPTLKGNRAIYAEVLAGVDLVLTAHENSFSQVLVVKSASAGRQPALATIDIALVTSGLRISKPDDGSVISAIDGLGRTVFSSAPPLMWDSRGRGTAEDNPLLDRTVRPVEGDRVVDVPVAATQTLVSMTPSRSLLDDPFAVYPVYIDPPFRADPSGRAMIDRRYPSSSYWNWSGDQGVGFQNFDGWSHKRLFFQFYIPESRGQHVISAWFSAFQVWASSCAKTEVQLWETTRFTSTASWNNSSSAWLRHVASMSTSAGREGCNNEGQLVNFGVTNLLQRRADAKASYVYMGLRAADEANPYAWKRFKYNATLSVNYNTPPPTPGMDRLKTSDANCVNSGTGAPNIGRLDPDLAAYLTDADTAGGDTIQAVYEVWVPGGQKVWSGATGFYGGSRWFHAKPAGLQDQKYYWWHVRVFDGTDWSGWSQECFFRIDVTAPSAPKITLSVTNRIACPDPNEAKPCYPLGQALTFSISPNGVSDVTRFGWSINVAEPAVVNVPVSPGTVTTTLRTPGPVRLYAWSYDATGHESTRYDFEDLIVVAPAQTGSWRIDEGSGATLADSSGFNHPMTLGSGATWHYGDKVGNNPSDRAIVLWKGLESNAATSASNVVNASESFTVSARVRLGTNAAKAVVVSEDRPGKSSFTLGIESNVAGEGDSREVVWSFAVPNPANPTQEVKLATDPMSYHPSEWVLLTGTYDAAEHRLHLFVNLTEVAQGDPTKPTTTPVTMANVDGNGPLRLGRAIDASVNNHYWLGVVDDVNVFNGPLSKEGLRTIFTS